jgi:hypothetical protein
MAITNADILGWLNANPNANDDLIYKTMVEAGVTTEQYLSATGKPLPRGTSTSQVTNADILGWFNANPGASDELIARTMQEAGVSPTRLAEVTGAPVAEVVNRYQAAIAAPVAPTVAPSVAPPPPERLLGGPVQMPPPVPTVTNADILGWFNANPNASDELIAQTMKEAGVTPTRLAQVTGAPAADVAVRYATALSPTVTDYQGAVYDTATILKLAQQITPSIDPNAVRGGVFKTSGESVGFNYDEASKILGKAPTAAEQVVLDMARHLAKEGVTDLSQVDATETNRRFGSTFTGGGGTIYEIKKDAEGKPIISTWSKDTSDKKTILTGLALAALAFGIPGVSEGLLSTAPAGATIGTTALTAAEAAGLGLTAAEASALGLSAAEFAAASVGPGLLTTAQLAQLDLALGGAGGTPGATSLAGGLATGATIPTITSLTGGSGLLTGAAGGITAESVAAKLAADAATQAQLLNAGAGAFTPTYVPPTTTPGLLTPTVVPPTGVPPVGVPPTGIPPSLINAGVSTAVNSLLGTGGTTNIPNLISGGLGTAGNLLQMQESREAAQRAQARIDAETAAAKASAAFRPVGMTTRFGTSQFQVDPVTGQLTSAGYTLSPEAKAQQDRFMALSQQGLTQAEQAQAQFAPLQTGAQRLFGLGNQYLAQSPEAVAQNYLNQQMALLQPGRELELANLQNRLQQQGRGGLAVAQGGAYGATTPELQALFNARAQQEAVLAAQAQQAGQQQVAFGAGLLGTGAQTMGQYYGGQQAAYAPYTTAMGQVQGLEALGQQPFQMGAQLGQTASTAGARVGQLGLQGAGQSVALATGADATRNLGAQSLIAAGNPNAQFGSAIGGLLGGGLQSAFSGTGLGASGFGTGLAFGNQDLGLYL